MPEVLKRACYTLRVDGSTADLTLYGQIVENRPWWAEDDEQFIALSEFIKDLDTLKGKTSLTIHLNSLGGDAYSSIAIHNRLRELSREGTHIDCIVDGAAMSGGSLIMCAADHVSINPSSLVLIHDCWTFVWDSANSTSLRKTADQLDQINASQAEIYVRKTGKAADDIRTMMQEETLMTGREAVEQGFCDELIEDAEDSDISVSADKRTLFVHGHRMRVAAMAKLPDTVKVVESAPEALPTQGSAAGGDNTPEASGKKGGCKTMTLEEFRKENPEAAEELLAEARASVEQENAAAIQEAEENGRNSERARCSEIDELHGVFDDETIRAAKYGENPCTAQEMAFRAAQEMARQGRSFLNQMQTDYQESGADGVGAAPGAEEETPVVTNADRKAAGAAMAKKLNGKKTKEV